LFMPLHDDSSKDTKNMVLTLAEKIALTSKQSEIDDEWKDRVIKQGTDHFFNFFQQEMGKD
jgi:hypothetical protein